MVVKLLLNAPAVLQYQITARHVGTLIKQSEQAISGGLLSTLEVQRNFSKKRDDEKEGSVLAVKKPLSAYFLFLKDNHSKMKSVIGKNPSPGQLLQRISKEWRALNSQDKEKYQAKAQALVKESEQKKLVADKLRQKLDSFTAPPLASYNLFIKLVFQQKKKFCLKAENFANVPSATPNARLIKLAGQWKQLSAVEKSKYESKAKQLADEHKAKLKQLSERDLKGLGELKVEKRLTKLKRLGRKSRKQQREELAAKYKRPKKPLSGPFLFRASIESQLKGPAVEKAKVFGQRWNQLSDEQKKSFVDRAHVSMEKHRKDLVAWEKDMIAKGHKDVVAKFHTQNDLKFLPQGTRIPGAKHRRPAKKAGLKKKKAASSLRKKGKGKKMLMTSVGKKAKKALSSIAKNAKAATKKVAKKIGASAGNAKKQVEKKAEKIAKKATITKK